MNSTVSLFDTIPQEQVETCRRLGVHRLTYRNFKRFEEYVLEPEGENLAVYGDNETGKSTLMDGCMWLLYDKDSLNRKDFEIKPLNELNEPTHHLEHEVEGVFILDGRSLTLRKVLKEKWTKKRGEPIETFTGHETAYYVDGVPTSKGDYERRIASILDEEAFRLLVDPRYFNEVLHWTKRRALLLEVCGDVTDAQVIESDERLSGLVEILGERSLEDHRKVIASRRSKINKELQDIPIRISEATRALPDCSGTEPKLLEAESHKLQAQKNDKSGELARLEQGGGVGEKTAELRSIQSRMADLEAQARRAVEDALAQKKRTLQQAQYEGQQAERTYRNLAQEAEAKAQEAQNLGQKLETLRSQWEQIDEEEFTTYSGDTVCPTCGQDLPEEQVEDARRKAEEAFNLLKAQRLEQNESEGKTTVQRKKLVESEAQKLRDEAALWHKKIQTQKALCDKLQAELAKMPTTATITNPEHNKLAMERETLTMLIARMKEDSQAAVAPLRQEIAEIASKIQDFQQQKVRFDMRKQGEKRIEELRTQEKQLAAEFEKLEHELYLTEEFMRVKVRMLEDRIASKFSFVRFKMFDQQVNGGLAECCETLVKGVPYSRGLNNGGKIQAGLDVINTLQKHYGFVAPIWLDNRESVTWIPDTRAQVVSLIVSPKDKVLRVEREES